ncbi:MAG: metallopeptidase TldD-related protein [Bacteriovorax sp.]|nr:metallopeptidase TldD-related protein [Bacteriovorax sp.]
MKHDILTLNEESLSIEVIAGKINSYRNKNIIKKGIRLFENNKIYSTSFVGQITDADLLKKASAAKSVGIPFDYTLATNPQLKTFDEESMKAPLSAINEAIELSQERLAKYSKDFVFNGKFERSIHTRTMTNADGMKLERKFAYNEWHYLFKRVGSPNLMDGYFEESGKTLDIKDVFDKNLPYLEAYKNEITFKDGKYPVLFIEGGQFGKLAESLIAEKYCEGSALFSGKLNTKIFSPEFSLYDVNYSPAHGIYKKFDGEGTIRELSHLPLIEKGVMKNIIADLRTSKKYGIEATGNGQRSSDSAVSTGFNALVLGAGKRSTQDILNGLEECVVVFMGHGGDFTDKGDFSTPLQLSYLVKKGEIIGRLPQLTVKSTTQDMFGSRLLEIASNGFQKSNLQPSLFSEMDVYVN